jgi:hypothetical protein
MGEYVVGIPGFLFSKSAQADMGDEAQVYYSEWIGLESMNISRALKGDVWSAKNDQEAEEVFLKAAAEHLSGTEWAEMIRHRLEALKTK